MKVDLRTLVQVRRRMEAAAVPLLFHDVRTPDRQVARVARIMSWFGPAGRNATTLYVVRQWNELPPAGPRIYGRWSR